MSTTAKSITITNAIPTALAIDNIEVIITGIRNPSPALVTGSFLATIGVDTSAADVSGTVSLMPGLLTGLIINFDPATVNTTANMIVTATLGNTVPANGSIVVTFPATTWARQATPSYTIPISSVSSCSAITVPPPHNIIEPRLYPPLHGYVLHNCHNNGRILISRLRFNSHKI